MHIRFIALNLGTPDRFWKGDILSSSCCHAVSQPFDFLNRRMFVQRIRQNFWVSCRKCGGIAFNRSRNIAVFRNIVYILVTKGHVISTLARLSVRSKSDIFENYMDKSRILCLLKWCMVWYGLWNWNMFSRIDKCSPIRFSVVTQHLMSRQIGSEKGFIWKQGNHTRFEYARISLIESVPEQQWKPNLPNWVRSELSLSSAV